jgi:Cu(I)/Ag(I) efflux system membrane fusion protein
MIRFIAAVLLLAAIFAAGLYLEKRYALFDQLLVMLDKNMSMDMDMNMETGTAMEAKPKEKEILYWIAPMDPNYRSDQPGKSPMGMDLVPVYADEDGGNENTVKISPEVINNIGVRTERVQRGRLPRPINTVGYVTYDESRISHIHLRVDGWIEKLVADAEDERVKKGQLLFTLYSPTLVNAQEEYLQVLTRQNQRLIESTKERLVALGLTNAQIKAVAEKGKPEQYLGVYAPQSGVISELNVREGMYLKPDNNIMTIASLDTVWMQAEVFEEQINWVREGQAVVATLPSSPGKEWLGKVDYIYPELDSMTRTLRVRLKFENPDEYLKPNMYAFVSINTEHGEPVLHVNRQAVIRDGRQPRVIVALGEGRFEPRLVRIGMVNGDRAEIIEGLEAGETVVTSAQFLIDSEASLSASLHRMTPLPEKPDTMETSMRVIKGIGVINSINTEARTVNINHEPIPALDWPAMTMDITVADDINLERVSQWEKIHFYMVKDDAGTYYIRRIDPLTDTTGETP